MQMLPSTDPPATHSYFENLNGALLLLQGAGGVPGGGGPAHCAVQKPHPRTSTSNTPTLMLHCSLLQGAGGVPGRGGPAHRAVHARQPRRAAECEGDPRGAHGEQISRPTCCRCPGISLLGNEILVERPSAKEIHEALTVSRLTCCRCPGASHLKVDVVKDLELGKGRDVLVVVKVLEEMP